MVRLGGVEGMNFTAASVFENPASLSRIDRFSSSFFMTQLMEEVMYQNIALAFRTKIGVLGLGFMTVGVDEIPKTLERKFFDGSEYFVDYYFNYQNSMAKASYQFSFSRYAHVGVSGTYYYSDFEFFHYQFYLAKH